MAGEDNEEKGQDTSEGGDDGMRRLQQEEVGEWAASGGGLCIECRKVNGGKSIFIFDKII